MSSYQKVEYNQVHPISEFIFLYGSSHSNMCHAYMTVSLCSYMGVFLEVGFITDIYDSSSFRVKALELMGLVIMLTFL